MGKCSCSCKLSHALLDAGFFSALGTCENLVDLLGGPDPHIVGRGTPFTWDANNGVTVIYDEEGRPWIKQSRQISEEDKRLLSGQPMTRAMTGGAMTRVALVTGAYVPHSNDGGRFVCRVLPSL